MNNQAHPHLFIWLLLLWVGGGALQARTIRVGTTETVKTIREGIALAGHCDTVLVTAGVYSEGNLIIQKPIILLGQGRPVIDGLGQCELFTIAAQQVTLAGFVLRNSGRSNMEDWAGVKCLDAHYAVVADNVFEHTYFGVHISNSDHVTVSGNQFTTFAEQEYELGNGIHLWECAYATIADNTIRGHRDGIYFEFVTNSVVRGNVSEGNMRYGLHFMFSHDNGYFDNVFRNNGAGVAVMYTRHVRMHRNTFDQNWGSSAYGLLLKDITDSEVFDNAFVGNTTGVYMEGTNRTVFLRNTFQRNGWAVRLQANCDHSSFGQNNFIANSFDIATNGTLVMNTVDGNYWDKYQGYDMDKDGAGDVPYRPISLFSTLTEHVPPAIMLWRSFLVFLMDNAERVTPAITPENLKDNTPKMSPYDFS
jgi:nitrous oxidase accessory protein